MYLAVEILRRLRFRRQLCGAPFIGGRPARSSGSIQLLVADAVGAAFEVDDFAAICLLSCAYATHPDQVAAAELSPCDHSAATEGSDTNRRPLVGVCGGVSGY